MPFFFVKMKAAMLQSVFSHNIGAMHNCNAFFLCENERCTAAKRFFTQYWCYAQLQCVFSL
jgi:hypothetical protein